MVNVLSVCFSALFLSNIAFARALGPHNDVQKRTGEAHHAALVAARSGSPRDGFVAARNYAKRNGRCAGRNSTSSITSSTAAIGNPAGYPTTTTSSEVPTTATSVTTTTTAKDHPHHAHNTPHLPLTTSSSSYETTTAPSGGGGSSGDYSGDGTYYGVSLGACGWTNTDNELVAAVSHILYDGWPGATANPNNNPICGRYATAHYGSNSVTVKVVDRCVGCGKWDLDFSTDAFKILTNNDLNLGRIHITWKWA